MSVLLYAEHNNGTFKSTTFQAASFAGELASKMGTELYAVAIGDVSDDELTKLGNYGVSKIYKAADASLNDYSEGAYAAVVAEAAKSADAKAVVFAQSYGGNALSPRVSIKLDSALLSGLISLPDPSNGFLAQRSANSGKGVETIKTNKSAVVITVKANAFTASESSGSTTIEAFSPSVEGVKSAVSKEVVKVSSKVSITEADTVVSGGRGLKGPENWNILEELAAALEAGTACSKPVADMDWRPHHEHVGQTGIQIAPNLYIAMGISGAIQHLAGVNSSKNIVVINKDPEAPFFKIADYGIIGDLFEVVPKMTEAAKKLKATV